MTQNVPTPSIIEYRCQRCDGPMDQLVLPSYPPIYRLECQRCGRTVDHGAVRKIVVR